MLKACAGMWCDMEKKRYLIAGQFRGGKQSGLGLVLYRLQEDGGLTCLQRIREDIAAGWLCTDPGKELVYAIHAKPAMPGRIGGGACVYTFRFDRQSGQLSEVGCVCTLSAMPSYVTLDREKKHIFVSHNGNAEAVTKISRDRNGKYRAETVLDDAAVTELALDENGVPGEIQNIFVPENEGEFGPRAVIQESSGGILSNPGTSAHLHCVAVSPDGRTMVCCDFGQGKIHSFCLHEKSGEMEHRGVLTVPVDDRVRYAAFHPSLPLVYFNFENAAQVLVCRYDSGEIFPAGKPTEFCGQGSRDFLLNSSGTRMYLALTDNAVCVLEVLKDGTLRYLGRTVCLGTGARALALIGNRLYCGCNRSDTIEVFDLDENGLPKSGRIAAKNVSASVLKQP